MRTTLRAGVTIAATIAFGAAAWADMSVYYHAGNWDAFSGPGANGKMVCGIGSTNPTDSHSFSLRFTIGGDDTVMLQARKPSWTIPTDTRLPVVMQIGLDAPWNMQGIGNAQEVEWTIDSAAMQTFDAQFRRANSMTVNFPTGNEPPWTIRLNGSTAISNAFGRCVTDLMQRAGTPQPASAASEATQPFGRTPPQPVMPNPAQPTQPTQQR